MHPVYQDFQPLGGVSRALEFLYHAPAARPIFRAMISSRSYVGGPRPEGCFCPYAARHLQSECRNRPEKTSPKAPMVFCINHLARLDIYRASRNETGQSGPSMGSGSCRWCVLSPVFRLPVSILDASVHPRSGLLRSPRFGTDQAACARTGDL